jgi:transcriptional regulator with XRE-family HTH domain
MLTDGDTAMTALSQTLIKANVDNISARLIARRAKAAGYTLNHDTVARYLRGDHGRPDEPTLVAFSAILGVPLATLRSAADLPSELVEPYLPPAEASRLSRRQRKAVDEIIRSMLEPAAQGAEVTALPTRGSRSAKASPKMPAKAPTKATGTATRPKAARRGRNEGTPG